MSDLVPVDTLIFDNWLKEYKNKLFTKKEQIKSKDELILNLKTEIDRLKRSDSQYNNQIFTYESQLKSKDDLILNLELKINRLKNLASNFIDDSFACLNFSERQTIPFIDDLDFISNSKFFYNYDSSFALNSALDYCSNNGFLLTLPEIMNAKSKLDKNHDFWKNGLGCPYSEEYLGLDKKGVFVKPNDPVIVAVHGGGLLTPEKLKKANTGSRFHHYYARFSEDEFDNFLEGILFNGNSIKLYHVDEIKQGVLNLPHNFGVVVPFKDVIDVPFHSESLDKSSFLSNPLAIARTAGLSSTEKYYDLATSYFKGLTNESKFYVDSNYKRDPSVPQGCFLDLYKKSGGIVFRSVYDGMSFLAVKFN